METCAHCPTQVENITGQQYISVTAVGLPSVDWTGLSAPSKSSHILCPNKNG